MSNKNITKSAIAGGMKVLMNMEPFDDITVTDIIKKSGVSRKTFYYHFKDKYDLVNWIFSVEIIDPLIEDTSIEHLIYCYTRLCCYIEKNETFCRNAINASGQNCFVDFLKSYVGKQVSIIGKQCDKNNILKEDDYTFLNDYYYNAFIGI